MAQLTTKHIAGVFPVGTVVGLYEGVIANSGVPFPAGPKIAEATVSAAESLTWEGLTIEQAEYFAAAKISGTWRIVGVGASQPTGTGSGGSGSGGLSEAEVEEIAVAKAASAVAAETALRESADTERVAKTERSASTMGVVNHGATGSTARPSGYAFITWIGSAEPTHAAEHDIWIKG